jgi:N-acetylmuramoyl-L-alanine amidase
MMTDPELPQSVSVFARTLWGEGRSTGASGMTHIASVIMNRIDHPRWWGDDVIDVCQAPFQFSCWNDNDPNLPKLLAVTTDDPEFEMAVLIATQAMKRNLPDATDGADSYYALSMKEPPVWAVRATRTIADGFHVFMRVELAAPTGNPDAPTVSVNAPDEADILDSQFNPEVP